MTPPTLRKRASLRWFACGGFGSYKRHSSELYSHVFFMGLSVSQKKINLQQQPQGGSGGPAPDLNELGLPRGYNFRDDWEVAPRRVKAMLDAGEDFVMIDCRTPQEHQIARIEGALLVPLQELGSRMVDIQDHADKKVVVFCHHGGRSLRMAGVLRQEGFSDVYSMAGGIDIWAVGIDRSLARY